VRICLITAPISSQFNDPLEYNDRNVRRQSTTPQLGVLSLAAVIEKQGLAVTVFDLNRAFFRLVDEVGEAQVEHFAAAAARQIAETDSEVYGFSSICSGYPLTLRIAALVKEIRPDSAILIGGPQASVVTEPTLRAFPAVDFILRGEAEQSLPIFLEELATLRRFEKVPGLSYRSVFGVQSNPDAPVVADLDALPRPAYHVTGELRGASAAALELGRGCPFACTFCSTNDFFRRKFRLRSPQRVLDDMCAIHDKYGISAFELVHDMFTVDAKRVRAFCHYMIASGKGFTWTCSARTDCVDEDLIEVMAAAGCKSLFFGIETGTERMQKIIDKHLNIERAHAMIDFAERAGIASTVSLITGFPEEQWEDLKGTMRFFMHSARTPQSSPQITLLAPLANTPLHLKHRHEMTLEYLSSGCSHQGRYQNSEDVRLIKQLPDIFPNFYLLPTPNLDRALLLELREFAGMATVRFRWLLGAADQASGGILELFVEWVDYRKSIFPADVGPDLRHYYRTEEFGNDLVTFLSGHSIATNPKLKVLLEFYRNLDSASSPEMSTVADAIELERTEPMHLQDIPVRTCQSRVVWLDGDLNAAIGAVRDFGDYHPRQGRTYYFVSQSGDQEHPGFRVSAYLARELELCDGQRTVAEIVECLAEELSLPLESVDDEFCQALFEKARSEQLIAIYRPVSVPPRSPKQTNLLSEYGEITTLA